MKRLAPVAPALAIVIAVATSLTPGSGAGSLAALRQDDVRSGGIGLSRDDWEADHGPGDPGQSLVTYEGGAYSVAFEDDVVTFLELGWEDQGNVAFDEAEDEVEDLLPSDAELVETYFAPATAGGPISLQIQRYESDALEDLLAGGTGDRTGGILVIYQETPAADQFERDVARASMAVGTES